MSLLEPESLRAPSWPLASPTERLKSGSTWNGGELGLWVPAEGVDGEGETDDAEASLQPSPTMSHLLFCLSVQPVAPIPP
jgi:hypothetical protein